MDTTELLVERGRATPAELQETIDEILAEIASGQGEVASETRNLGVEINAESRITVRDNAQGFEPFSALALAFATGVGKALVTRFWDDVIRPEIRRRRGAD